MTQHDRLRYATAMHAMQSVVAFEVSQAEATGQRNTETEPKHLRVGVNSALLGSGAVAKLLVDKDIFSTDELEAALAVAAEAEWASYQDRHPGMKFR